MAGLRKGGRQRSARPASVRACSRSARAIGARSLPPWGERWDARTPVKRPPLAGWVRFPGTPLGPTRSRPAHLGPHRRSWLLLAADRGAALAHQRADAAARVAARLVGPAAALRRAPALKHRGERCPGVGRLRPPRPGPPCLHDGRRARGARAQERCRQGGPHAMRHAPSTQRGGAAWPRSNTRDVAFTCCIRSDGSAATGSAA